MHKSCLVWQLADFRIVAVDADPVIEDDRAMLLVESKYLDQLGEPAWSLVDPGDGDGVTALIIMSLEIASRIEVLPSWVKQLVREQMEEFQAHAGCRTGEAS